MVILICKTSQIGYYFQAQVLLEQNVYLDLYNLITTAKQAITLRCVPYKVWDEIAGFWHRKHTIYVEFLLYLL